MELEEIAKEKERSKEDERYKEDEGVTELTPEDKTKEEAEPHHYSKLQNPSENIYSEAFHAHAMAETKAGKETAGKTRLYRFACLLLAIICLVLLVIVIILSLKLQSGDKECPVGAETAGTNKALPPSFPPSCSQEDCQTLFSGIRPEHLGCRQCADGWRTYGRSCFYLSTYRLSFDESQKNCSARGGALAVVSSWGIQEFLTQKGKMNYWLGLKNTGTNWSWVNGAELTQSYWEDSTSEKGCGILSTNKPPEKNWSTARCDAATYFICQLQF